ncbi:hypothetical protein [Oryza sativa Japonica Group]|uniref:Uncharacterized protein n=1 Tax=Oryza sativa subsp. japonica TaxID=39947 RepID=Q5VQW2_ORYSJ|nr:hypothetical protein [Oryza sativa Japonica Group]BAD68152.1 hypothetical protein [Oryza sativa Japonica Group]
MVINPWMINQHNQGVVIDYERKTKNDGGDDITPVWQFGAVAARWHTTELRVDPRILMTRTADDLSSSHHGSTAASMGAVSRDGIDARPTAYPTVTANDG